MCSQRRKPAMAQSSTLALTLSLQILLGTSALADASVSHRDAAIVTAMKDVGHTLQCLGDAMQQGLHLIKGNSEVLRDLHSRPDTSSVYILTQEIKELKLQLGDKDQEIQDLQGQLDNKTKESEQNYIKVQDLDRALGESQKRSEELQQQAARCNQIEEVQKPAWMKECKQPRLQEISRVVREFVTTRDWGSLRRSLGPLLDQSSEEYTQLQAASSLYDTGYYGSVGLAKLLLCGGLPVDTGDDKGVAMLHGAAYYDTGVMVDLLVDRGADVNLRDDDGKTPLMYAASDNILKTTRRLVELGADTTLKDNRGNRALDYAGGLLQPVVEEFLKRQPH